MEEKLSRAKELNYSSDNSKLENPIKNDNNIEIFQVDLSDSNKENERIEFNEKFEFDNNSYIFK